MGINDHLYEIAEQVERLDDCEIDRLARILVRRGQWATTTLVDCLNNEFAAVVRELELELN